MQIHEFVIQDKAGVWGKYRMRGDDRATARKAVMKYARAELDGTLEEDFTVCDDDCESPCVNAAHRRRWPAPEKALAGGPRPAARGGARGDDVQARGGPTGGRA